MVRVVQPYCFAAAFLWCIGFWPSGLRDLGLHLGLVDRGGALHIGAEGCTGRHQVVLHLLAIVVPVATLMREESMPLSVTRYSLVLTARCAAA